MTSATGQAELLLVPKGHAPVGLVLFMHGLDSNQDQLLTNGGLRPVRDALLSAGYALMASDAHGDNAGNPASVQDQYDAYSDARTVLRISAPVYVLAFSMGGLDALLVAAKHVIPGLQALALLSPATDQQAFLKGRFGSKIAAAFSTAPGPGTINAIKAWDPILAPATKFRGYRYSFWQSRSDQTVPYSQSTRMIAHLDSGGVRAPLHPLTGNHGNLSALEPKAVLDLFAGTS